MKQKDKNTSVQNSISNLTQIGENNSVAAEEISASMIELSILLIILKTKYQNLNLIMRQKLKIQLTTIKRAVQRVNSISISKNLKSFVE